MPTNVRFRITGMYFGSKESITKEIAVDVAKAKPSVYDVMVEVVKKVAAGQVPGVAQFIFDPVFPSATDSLNSITVEYSAAPKGSLDSGLYFLQENKMTNPVYVFQYYHYDKNFNQKNNNNKTANFAGPPDNDIVDDDIILWRQVAIMQGANGKRRVQIESAKGLQSLRQLGAF